MSSKDMARRASFEVSFDGIDITGSMRPYFLSMTYTDNEEDETDDLQIKLQDREGLWMCKWLNDAVQAAASTAAASGGGGAKAYKVTAKSGLNVRSGPGTNYSKLGALPYGAVVQSSGISGGWASIDYGGKGAYVSANYLAEVGGSSQEPATTGDRPPELARRWKGRHSGLRDV